MKSTLKISFLFICYISSLSSSGQEMGKSDVYTLQDCIDYALKNSVAIKNSRLEQEIARTKVGETRGQGLPQVNGLVDFTNNYKLRKSRLPASALNPNSPSDKEAIIAFGTKYAGTANLNVSQLIFDGSYFVGLKAAKTYAQLSHKENIKTEIDVIEAVTKAYYSVLVNEERLELLEKNYGRLDTLLNETREMYKNGFVEKIDVDRLRVNFNNLKVQKTNLKRLNELSVDLLKFQMGMPVGDPITLEGDLDNVAMGESLLSEEGGSNYENRIEYSQLLTNETLIGLSLKNNKVQYLPRLTAFLNHGYNLNGRKLHEYFQPRERWLKYGNFGLSLNVPLFDGLMKSYRVQKDRLQLLQIENQKSLLENSIDLEMSQSRKQLKNNLEMLASQKENMELAEEVYNITKIKYQEGVGSNLEVINADADYKEAQTNYFNALYDALIAKVDLDKAYGGLKKSE